MNLWPSDGSRRTEVAATETKKTFSATGPCFYFSTAPNSDD